MKKIFLILILLSTNAFACMNDFEGGAGNACVEAEESLLFEGICVHIGSGIYTSAEPHKIAGCQFNTDCNGGSTCVKGPDIMYGVCINQN